MGKNLRPEIIAFFLARMREHRRVARCEDLSTRENYIFRLQPRKPLPPVTVWLADDYCFTLESYLNKPECLAEGDCILIARPEGSATSDAQGFARADGVLIAKISELMGALHARDVCAYLPRDRRNDRRTG